MYEAAHSGTWLRGRLGNSSELSVLIRIDYASTYFLPNFMLHRLLDR